MPVSITIRDVPDDVRDALASRAAGSGRSLQEYLKGQLADLAYRPVAAEVVVELRRRAAHLPPLEGDDLLADIDADRR
ncbi:FitA-like ribbon-helix-helix domain-containing protein [Litorihabitans aurantiacus]|uniref:Antitoxin FitA-like ribbon-helix-helix domain-containing protein n=1 Tax=Litorihabitans aurantiacus TaxID=1930061 RepID=A0AA37XH52_9MICO|nr:hypothetical protein [Litorihabitans aurantiacus]GMA33180.1 hypothetical protein GCM10025875_31720 [Litorihabitans aurantiacus]